MIFEIWLRTVFGLREKRQFVPEPVGTIRELLAKCQQMHFTSFEIAVPLYPALYTYVGRYFESYIARHTRPDPSIPKNIDWSDAQATLVTLVEDVYWEAWVTPHIPSVMPNAI